MELDDFAQHDPGAGGARVDVWPHNGAPVTGTGMRAGSMRVDVEHARRGLQDLHRQTESLLGAWMAQARILIGLADLGDRLAAATPGPSVGMHRGTLAWASCRISLVLSERCAETILTRAAQWHVDAGGRFQALGSSIVLWSETRQGHSRGGAPRIMAFAVLERQCPAPGQATLTHLAWKPSLGGSAAVMWQALEVLAGGPLAGSDERGQVS